MPSVWFSVKKSLHCKSDPSDVVDPKARSHHVLPRRAPRSGCSRSIANLKDVVIHGSKRHVGRPASCSSPRSIGSSEFLNPITHEVILSTNSSKCELKITGFGHEEKEEDGGGGKGVGSTFVVGTLRPGTPGPGAHLGIQCNPSPPKRMKSPSSLSNGAFGNVTMAGASREAASASNWGCVSVSCHRCGEQFGKWETLEAHHLSKHAVTELVEGDSSRKIVEIICRTSWLKSESNCGRIERVLKVHNMQKTLARFEEHREAVKIKASKLPKKHPRCLADGNELLRFYGTTIACPLGTNGSSSLCVSEKCGVCEIIRNGFSIEKGGIGVFTSSTSGRAFELIGTCKDSPTIRRALIVCRVVAGRVHRPLENVQEMAGQSGFDSLAGKVGLCANIEELYLLNPRALLPCFVVMCKP